jgi:hypothetical protein
MKKIQNEVTPPRQLTPSLSERVDWAILRAMSADPGKRPASCREFIEDLTGKSTRRPPADAAVPQQEMWYLVYKDETGAAHTVKGTVSAIRRSLKDGLLGDASNVRASRIKAGPFEALRGYPEFRDLVVTAAPLSVPQPSAPRHASPNDVETVQAQPYFYQEPPPAVTPKPADHSEDAPRSTGMEILKWLCFIALFILTATIAYLFF